MSSKSFKTFCKYAANSEEILAKLSNLLNQGQDWLTDNPKAKDAILAAALGTGLGGISGATVAGKGKRLKGALIGAGLGGGIGAATPTLKDLLLNKMLNSSSPEKAYKAGKWLGIPIKRVKDLDTNEIYPYADLPAEIPELMTINELNKHASASGSLTDKLQSLLNKGSDYLEEIDKDPKKRMLLTTALGTGVGGLAGAGIAGKGNRLKGALIGAGLGGGIGAGASYARDLYKDYRSNEKIKKDMESSEKKRKEEEDKEKIKKDQLDYLKTHPELLLNFPKDVQEKFLQTLAPMGVATGGKSTTDLIRPPVNLYPNSPSIGPWNSNARPIENTIWDAIKNRLPFLNPGKAISPQAALENWASMYPGH